MADFKKRNDGLIKTLSQPVRHLIAYTMPPPEPYTRNERDDPVEPIRLLELREMVW